MRTLVNISYCASHHKGADPGVAPRLDGIQHARWLLDAVDYWRELPYAIAISMTAWRGMLNVEAGGERDLFWQILDRVDYLLGVPENPSHQVGAALCIRQGLECASKLHYDCMIHTAEDVVVDAPWVLHELTKAIREGFDYAGEAWGGGRPELNAQFFACNPHTLAAPWDSCRVPDFGCIERYLHELLHEKPTRLLIGPLYRTTHDYEQWCRWREEVVK